MRDLARLIDTASTPIFGIDDKGLVTEWNQKMTQMTGVHRPSPTAWRASAIADGMVCIGHRRGHGGHRPSPTAWRASAIAEAMLGIGHRRRHCCASAIAGGIVVHRPSPTAWCAPAIADGMPSAGTAAADGVGNRQPDEDWCTCWGAC